MGSTIPTQYKPKTVRSSYDFDPALLRQLTPLEHSIGFLWDGLRETVQFDVCWGGAGYDGFLGGIFGEARCGRFVVVVLGTAVRAEKGVFGVSMFWLVREGLGEIRHSCLWDL